MKGGRSFKGGAQIRDQAVVPGEPMWWAYSTRLGNRPDRQRSLLPSTW